MALLCTTHSSSCDPNELPTQPNLNLVMYRICNIY